MKTLVSLAGCIIASILMLPAVYAQSTGVKAEDVRIKFSKISVTNQKLDEKFSRLPDQTDSGRADWGVISLEYEVGIEGAKGQKSDLGGLYLNELEFEWKVILSKSDKPRPENVVRLDRTVTYTDLRVESGNDRKKVAQVIIDARLLRRYLEKFDKSAIYWEVRVKSGGKTVDTFRGRGDDISKGDDYKSMFTNEDVYVRRDGLMPQTESPFGWYGVDSQDPIKPQQQSSNR